MIFFSLVQIFATNNQWPEPKSASVTVSKYVIQMVSTSILGAFQVYRLLLGFLTDVLMMTSTYNVIHLPLIYFIPSAIECRLVIRQVVQSNYLQNKFSHSEDFGNCLLRKLPNICNAFVSPSVHRKIQYFIHPSQNSVSDFISVR
jgi:hypothetical protein